MTPAAMRVFLQHGKALCKPDMRLIQLDDRNYVLASSPQMPVRKSRKIVDKSHVSEWQRADLLDQNLQGDLIISIVGRANLRRHEATRDPFMAQHQIRKLAKSALHYRVYYLC